MYIHILIQFDCDCHLINFLSFIKVGWTESWSCQREFLTELHWNSIRKFCIKFDRSNSIDFWIELHTTFRRTKSKFNLKIESMKLGAGWVNSGRFCLNRYM